MFAMRNRNFQNKRISFRLTESATYSSIELLWLILRIDSIELNDYIGISFREPVKSFLIQLKGSFGAGRKASSMFCRAFVEYDTV